MIFKKIFFILIIFTLYTFALLNCTENAKKPDDRRRDRTGTTTKGFEPAEDKSPSRNRRRRPRRNSSSGSTTENGSGDINNDSGDNGGSDDSGDDGGSDGSGDNGGSDDSGDNGGSDDSGDGGGSDGGENGDNCSPGRPYGNYSSQVARCPINDDGEPFLPINRGGPCVGNLLWLRENCNRLPDWLDQAASGGYERVEINSNGDVVWHGGVFFGLWKGGTWKNGAFLGERWENGHWERGEWRADNEGWITGHCYSFNDNGSRDERFTTTDSPAHPNSPCINRIGD